jgi:type VI secretion system secreted protein Hcp
MALVDYFLKIDTIPGESTDAKHPGEIDILSFSWGETNAGTAGQGSGSGGGKAQAQDFSFTKKVDKATPVLFVSCATGAHIKTATLTARKAGGKQEDYLIFKMSDILVSSYQTGGSAGSDIVPTEQVSINFVKLEMSYKEQKADGSLGGEVKQGYDFGKNVKI